MTEGMKGIHKPAIVVSDPSNSGTSPDVRVCELIIVRFRRLYCNCLVKRVRTKGKVKGNWSFPSEHTILQRIEGGQLTGTVAR